MIGFMSGAKIAINFPGQRGEREEKEANTITCLLDTIRVSDEGRQVLNKGDASGRKRKQKGDVCSGQDV